MNSINVMNPITREELAAFLSYNTHTITDQSTAITNAFEKMNDIISKKLSSIDMAINQQNETLTALSNAVDLIYQFLQSYQTSENNRNKKLIDIQATGNLKLDNIMKNMEKLVESKHELRKEFINTLSDEECNRWKNEVFDGRCREIMGKNFNYYSSAIMVYDEMKNAGVDINNLIKDARNNHLYNRPKELIAHSDYLRTEAELAISRLRDNYSNIIEVSKKNKFSVPLSMQLNNTPLEVKKCIVEYSKLNNTTYTKAQRELYKLIGKANKVVLSDEAKKFAKKYGYKNCCIGYLIGNTPKLFRLLCKLSKYKWN